MVSTKYNIESAKPSPAVKPPDPPDASIASAGRGHPGPLVELPWGPDRKPQRRRTSRYDVRHRRPSAQPVALVDDQLLAVEPGGFRRQQEHHHVDDFPGAEEAAVDQALVDAPGDRLRLGIAQAQ